MKIVSQICDELWARANNAKESNEVWESPDTRKEYYVESIDEECIRIHRDGTKRKNSVTEMKREDVRIALTRLGTKGQLSRQHKLVQPYAFGTTLAHFLPKYVCLEGTELIARFELTAPEPEIHSDSENNRSTSQHTKLPLPALDEQYFEAVNDEDARERILREVVQRRGQNLFRMELLKLHSGRCVVTGCTTTDVLEAAHIRPYNGDHTNVVTNGLLLRSDIHTLFDLNLLGINPDSLAINLSSRLKGEDYEHLRERKLMLPKSCNLDLIRRELRTRWAEFCNSDSSK